MLGMGTSSILIATILAVLKTLMGKPYTNDDLFYETLDVEQMMNTGRLLCVSSSATEILTSTCLD